MNGSPNRVCLVTGSSAGIGFQCAKKFLSEGYRVCICGRGSKSLETAVQRLDGGDSVLAIAGDIGEAATSTKLIESVMGQFGRLDVLVNNAGAAPLGSLETIDDETFEAVINTNIRAAFMLTQNAWPIFKQQGIGSIVNISSLAAIDPFPGFSIYGASKAWLETFTKAIAAEGEEAGIRVCCVRPGAVETDLLRSLFPDFPPEQCVSPADIADKVWACVDDPENHPSGEAFTVSK